MTAFTVTTSTNFQDSAYSTRAGDDTYTINGGSLTIDTDTRYCTNATATTGNLGNVVISPTLGGQLIIDGTKVRLIPYNSGSSTVPTIGTTITQGSVTGYLLGVWSALNVAPTASGSSMPASGYIKVKNVSGGSGNYSSGALSGITATATGADVVGWIEVIGVEATNTTVDRLGSVTIQGAWFVAGTTSGSPNQTIQLPASLASTYYAGIYIETSVGSGVYEFWPSAGSQTGFGQNQYQGKVVWISSQGLVRIGNNGTSTDAYTPVSGLHIVIPNVNCISCTSATPTANDLSATLTTRYGFTTTGGGVISIDKANMAWALNCQQAYSVQLTNMCILENITIDEVIQPISWSLVGVGQSSANTQYALVMTVCFAGGTITNCVFSRALVASSGNYVSTMTDISGFTFNGCKFTTCAARGNATTGVCTALRAVNCVFENCTFIGGTCLNTTCNNMTYNNIAYIDVITGATITTNPVYLFTLGTSCSNILIEYLTFPISYCQPYNGILSVGTAGSTNIKLRNLGTYSSPLDLGAARVDDVAWSRTTTTATVTSPSHGIPTTGCTIYIVISTNTAALKIQAYAVTYVDANTFTFTCTNSGTTSGTISYYPVVAANLAVFAASGTINTIYIQRCFTPHTRTNLFTSDNSNQLIYMQNVFSDFANIPLFTQLNSTFTGCTGTPSLAAQTAVYGTHWLDYYEYGVAPNIVGQSWSRTTTTSTITAIGHNMRTGAIIVVTVSSDQSALPLGQYTVTALTSSTFTVTVPNAGSSSGTCSFTVCNGAISLAMNEASTLTTGLYTIDSGTPSFTSTGAIYMPTAGEQITFTMPSYILGHSSFPNALPVMGTSTIANYQIYYSIDLNDGNGFSSFKNFYFQSSGASGTSGQNVINLTSTTGINVNDYVTGTNVGPMAQVTSINSITQIGVSIANTGTVSGTLVFKYYPNETLSSSLGFKMKWRIYTNTTVATAITSLLLYTNSSDTDRQNYYSLDLVPIVITVLDTLGNPIQNARVAVFFSSDSTQITDQLTNSGGQIMASASYTGDATLDIRVRKSNSGETRYVNNDSVGTLTSSGFSSTVVMIKDTIASP